MSSCGVCLSVRPSVTFVNKDIFEFFSPSRSQAILAFPRQTGWQYSDGNPSNGGVEYRWGRQSNSGRISGFAAYRSTVLSTVRVGKCEKQPRRTAAVSSTRSPRRPSSIVCTRRRRSVCDGLDVICRRRKEVKALPDTTPLVITPVFCCRRTS